MIKKEQIFEELKKVIDPELNINIVDLGLIYDVDINPSSSSGQVSKKFDVTITMTLTTPGCPLSMVFDEWVPEAAKKVPGVNNVKIDLVWEPAWNPDKISDDAKEMLGIIR